MEIYPKQTVFCPQTNKEQNGCDCTSCEYYEAHRLDADRLLIDCKYGEAALATG